MKVALFVIGLCSFVIGTIVPMGDVRSQTVRNDRSYDYIAACWQKQCAPFQTKYLHLYYKETIQQLYPSAEPWQSKPRQSAGDAWFTTGVLQKSDTLHSPNGRVSASNSVLDPTALLVSIRGGTALAPVTKKDWMEAMFQSAKYSPVILLDYFNRRKKESTERIGTIVPDSGIAYYTLRINRAIVTLAIRMADTLVESVQTVKSDDLLGDDMDIYHYRSFRLVDGVSIPDSTESEKVDGKLKGGIRILSAEIEDDSPNLVAKPSDFSFTPEKINTPDVRVHKFSDHIYLIDLIHTDCRSMLVDFPDFLMVVDASPGSENGEMIIKEVRKIEPAKPIRYFTFGHFHSGSIGGIRPFIFRGATILTRAEDTAYVNFLAEAPHALDPDSLYLHPRPVQFEEIGDSLTISDGGYRMKIYYIGKKSRHANDYVIFYFPEENVLWDDDLTWVKKEGPIIKAIDRQAGLVSAIHDLGLHPKTVVQSWPLVQYGIKTTIPFADLEASLHAKSEIDLH